MSKALRLIDRFPNAPEDQILAVLHMAGDRSMTQDEITAVCALVMETRTNLALADLLLDGKLTAKFNGPDDEIINTEHYEFKVVEQ